MPTNLENNNPPKSEQNDAETIQQRESDAEYLKQREEEIRQQKEAKEKALAEYEPELQALRKEFPAAPSLDDQNKLAIVLTRHKLGALKFESIKGDEFNEIKNLLTYVAGEAEQATAKVAKYEEILKSIAPQLEALNMAAPNETAQEQYARRAKLDALRQLEKEAAEKRDKIIAFRKFVEENAAGLDKLKEDVDHKSGYEEAWAQAKNSPVK